MANAALRLKSLPTPGLAHSAHMKEEYQNIKILLSALKYDHHKWKVICDFKMVAFLVGFRVVLPSSNAISVSGIAEIQLFTTTIGTGH